MTLVQTRAGRLGSVVFLTSCMAFPIMSVSSFAGGGSDPPRVTSAPELQSSLTRGGEFVNGFTNAAFMGKTFGK
jgi:hypothetical protein